MQTNNVCSAIGETRLGYIGTPRWISTVTHCLLTSYYVTPTPHHPSHCVGLSRAAGFLDSSGQHENVPAEAKLELPLWLAHLLNVTTYKQIVSVRLPKLYRQTHRWGE